MRVRDDDRRAVVVLGLVERLHGRRGVGAHRDVRDVDVLVLHLHEAEVLLGLHLAGRRELRDRAAYATLRLCRPAGSINSEPSAFTLHIHLIELLIGFCKIDDALDDADHAQHKARHAHEHTADNVHDKPYYCRI